MHIQRMEPWRITALFEFLGVHMSILLCHRRKSRDAEIGQELAVFSAMEGAVLRRHLEGGLCVRHFSLAEAELLLVRLLEMSVVGRERIRAVGATLLDRNVDRSMRRRVVSDVGNDYLLSFYMVLLNIELGITEDVSSP